MCDTIIGYSGFAFGYQEDVGDIARAVGAKEPAIKAVLATIATRQVDSDDIMNIYNRL